MRFTHSTKVRPSRVIVLSAVALIAGAQSRPQARPFRSTRSSVLAQAAAEQVIMQGVRRWSPTSDHLGAESSARHQSDESGAAFNPPRTDCCTAARGAGVRHEGNLLNSWGGPEHNPTARGGLKRPVRAEHAIVVDPTATSGSPARRAAQAAEVLQRRKAALGLRHRGPSRLRARHRRR